MTVYLLPVQILTSRQMIPTMKVLPIFWTLLPVIIIILKWNWMLGFQNRMGEMIPILFNLHAMGTGYVATCHSMFMLFSRFQAHMDLREGIIDFYVIHALCYWWSLTETEISMMFIWFILYIYATQQKWCLYDQNCFMCFQSWPSGWLHHLCCTKFLSTYFH